MSLQVYPKIVSYNLWALWPRLCVLIVCNMSDIHSWELKNTSRPTRPTPSGQQPTFVNRALPAVRVILSQC